MSQADSRQWVLTALDQYEVRLVRYALSLVGDLDLARDAVQHTFFRLCDKSVVGTLRVPSDGNGTRSVPTTNDRLAAWLFRVCRNRALDHLRRAGREQSLDRLDNDGNPSLSPTSHEPDPAEAFEREELADLLRGLIVKLPAPQREALDLWREGFAYREIGEITGRQEGHVRVLVHRGLTKLREHPQVRGWLEDSRPLTPSGPDETETPVTPLAFSKK
jgi:RNA polymerase sigma factor (sigma-70 family)